jgi:hypothetical protein
MDTQAGAQSFAAYWFRALDWGYATTDSTLARSLYAPICTDCTRFMHNFDAPRRLGHHFRGGRLTVIGAKVTRNDGRHGADQAVDVVIDAQALVEMNGAGRIVGRSPAIHNLTYRVWASWTSGRWVVVDTKEVVA